MPGLCFGDFVREKNFRGVWFRYGRQHRAIYHRVESTGFDLDISIVEWERCLTAITVAEAGSEAQHLWVV